MKLIQEINSDRAWGWFTQKLYQIRLVDVDTVDDLSTFEYLNKLGY